MKRIVSASIAVIALSLVSAWAADKPKDAPRIWPSCDQILNVFEKTMFNLLRVLLVFCAVFVTACGGGNDTGPIVGKVIIWGSSSGDHTTTNEVIYLAGEAFVPRGASCYQYSGIWAPPGCICELGDLASGQWNNAATGATGPLNDMHIVSDVGCRATSMWWRISEIALQIGDNPITVSISDGTTKGSAMEVVVLK